MSLSLSRATRTLLPHFCMSYSFPCCIGFAVFKNLTDLRTGGPIYSQSFIFDLQRGLQSRSSLAWLIYPIGWSPAAHCYSMGALISVFALLGTCEDLPNLPPTSTPKRNHSTLHDVGPRAEGDALTDRGWTTPNGATVAVCKKFDRSTVRAA